MRRPQSAFGLVAVMSSLLVVSLFPAPADAARAPAEPLAAQTYDATGRCTAWSSETAPPKTIRVLRSRATGASRKVAGTVQQVDFRRYVEVVMAQEWPEGYPIETLKAGAIATKQFGWYYILNWRGGIKWADGKKRCYDVVDTTIDQWYSPERETVLPDGKIVRALDATWDVSVRKYKATTKSSRFFLTGYRAGSSKAACGEDATGFKLYHNSSKKCGQDGLTWREILRKYLRPNLEIVEPGRHDVIGTKHGDGTAMVRNDAAQWVARAWSAGRASPSSGAGLKIATEGVVGFESGDVNGDGDDDLIWFRKTGAKSGQIKVAISDGANYGPGSTWWEGNTLVPLDGAKLLVGDFHADDRTDVALLGRGEGPSTSRLIVFRRKPPGDAKKFGDPSQWWASGSHDHDKTVAAWAGDISGDGRADLIIRQNPSAGGVRVKSAVTKSPPPGGDQKMQGLKTRFDAGGLIPAKVKMIAGDANRDGREDVLLLVGGSGQAKIERLQGQLLGGFKRVKIWTTPKSSPIPVEKARLGIADVDYDGRTDLVLYIKRNGGTRVRVLKTRYDEMKPGDQWQESFSWSAVRPY